MDQTTPYRNPSLQYRLSAPTCRLGNRMGSPQDPNPRVSSAVIARSKKPQRLEARRCPNDKRTLAAHAQDDGRSSQAARRPSLSPRNGTQIALSFGYLDSHSALRQEPGAPPSEQAAPTGRPPASEWSCCSYSRHNKNVALALGRDAEHVNRRICQDSQPPDRSYQLPARQSPHSCRMAKLTVVVEPTVSGRLRCQENSVMSWRIRIGSSLATNPRCVATKSPRRISPRSPGRWRNTDRPLPCRPSPATPAGFSLRTRLPFARPIGEGGGPTGRRQAGRSQAPPQTTAHP